MRAISWGLALAAAVITAWLVWHGFEAPGPGSTGMREIPPRYAMSGAQMLRLDARGQPEFRARAALIEVYPDEEVRMNDLVLDALGNASAPWTLTAPAGRVPPRERRIELTGSVLASGLLDDGTPVRFTTSRLWVDLLRRELHTTAPAHLFNDFREARARGLRADFDGERLQLLDEVQVDYAPRG